MPEHEIKMKVDILKSHFIGEEERLTVERKQNHPRSLESPTSSEAMPLPLLHLVFKLIRLLRGLPKSDPNWRKCLHKCLRPGPC